MLAPRQVPIFAAVIFVFGAIIFESATAETYLSGGLVQRGELPEVADVHCGAMLHQQLSHLHNHQNA